MKSETYSKTSRLSTSALVATLSTVLVVAAGSSTADAHSGHKCRKNYYHCSMNAGGVLDASNPGCCWSPLSGPGNVNMQQCPSGFYKCDLNKNGRIDPSRPGCCLSDIRTKTDIIKLDTLANGLGFYRFRYKWDDQVYVGVMAQEVQALMPDAVVLGGDGFLRVNYDKVGAPFQTWEDWTASVH